MVFSINTVKESLNKPFPKNENITNFFNEDIFFIDNLEFVMEENREINNMISQTFSSRILKEESTLFADILNKVDLKKIVEKILTSFVEAMNRLWRDFTYFVEKHLVVKNREILFLKDNIKDVRKSFFYPYYYSIYANIGTNTSRTSLKYNLDEEFSKMCRELENINQLSTYDEISNKLKEVKNNFNNHDWEDELRGKIINKDKKIKISEFEHELRNFYRYKSFIDGYEIDPELLNENLNGYMNYLKNVRMVDKEIKDFKKHSQEIIRKINNLKFEDYIKSYRDNNDVKQIFLLSIKKFVKNIQSLTFDYTRAMQYKINAITEYYRQTRAVLLHACELLTMGGLS